MQTCLNTDHWVSECTNHLSASESVRLKLTPLNNRRPQTDQREIHTTYTFHMGTNRQTYPSLDIFLPIWKPEHNLRLYKTEGQAWNIPPMITKSYSDREIRVSDCERECICLLKSTLRNCLHAENRPRGQCALCQNSDNAWQTTHLHSSIPCLGLFTILFMFSDYALHIPDNNGWSHIITEIHMLLRGRRVRTIITYIKTIHVSFLLLFVLIYTMLNNVWAIFLISLCYFLKTSLEHSWVLYKLKHVTAKTEHRLFEINRGFPARMVISTIYHAWDTPFWSGTLEIVVVLLLSQN